MKPVSQAPQGLKGVRWIAGSILKIGFSAVLPRPRFTTSTNENPDREANRGKERQTVRETSPPGSHYFVQYSTEFHLSKIWWEVEQIIIIVALAQ
jgi:hypothetical protein